MKLGLRIGTTLLAVAAALALGVQAVSAMDFDCDPLISRARTLGETPNIKIDAKEGTVTMRTSFGSCRESIGKRDFGQIEPARTTIRPDDCTRRVAQLWEGDYHVIGDTRYWLEQVFTVDADRDGVTDNIGFTLLTMKDGQEVRALAYYFSNDALQASTVPDLTMPAGVTLGEVCFGQSNFAPPVAAATPKAFKAFDLPNLEHQMENQAQSREKASLRTDVASGDKLFALPFWVWAIGGSTAAVGGSVLVYRNHRRRVIERKLFGDADDDDDEA